VSTIEAVTFDFWNTLMWEGPDALVKSRMAALLGLLEESGLPVDESTLRSAHQVAFDRYQAEWRANRQFCVSDAVMVMAEELGIPTDLRLRARLTEAFDTAGDEAQLHLAEGIQECLERLHSTGVRLSIVCDIGLTPSPVLRRHLARRGLLDLFGSWAFSDEVGCYKPEAAIFEHALAGLGGVSPARAAHVGDRRRTDVAGARALGMTSVRYTGVYDDPDTEGAEADLVVDHYRHLPAQLC
jgi:putative hydrolase of the HAD superfamily